MRESVGSGGQEVPDVVHEMRGTCRLLDDPPQNEYDGRPLDHRLEFHCRLPGSACVSIVASFPSIVAEPGLAGDPSRRGPGHAPSCRLQYARNPAALRMRREESMWPPEQV